MTALTSYFCTTASTTLATANKALGNVATGASVTNKNTLIGTATGWGEIYAQGNASAWAAAGSAPAPSGHGFLDDGTTLETNKFSAGTWTDTIRLNVSAGSIVADIHRRAYQRTSGGTYTLIADMVLTAQNINTSITNYTLTVITGSASGTFSTGDKVYYHTIANITSNSTGSGAANLKMYESSSSTTGSTNAQCVTPGYVAGSGGVTVSSQNVTQTNILAEIITIESISMPLISNSAQMTYDILQDQYARIRASLFTIALLGITYYVSKQILNEHSLPGELDVLLNGETFDDLHVLKTIDDVTAFLEDESMAINQYFYLPVGWDTAWKNAKAAISGKQASIVGIGDSIMQGWNASDLLIDSWWSRLRSVILSANNNVLGGDHFGPMYSAAYETVFGGPSTANHPLVFGGTKGSDWDGFNGAYSYASFNYNALTPFVSCTPPYAVIGFDIVYIDYNTTSPAWSYQVDSGSTTNVATTGPGTNAGATVKKISITGLTAGTHTLKINSTSTVVACGIIGISAYALNGTGLCFANHGFPGMGLYAGLTAGNTLSDTATYPVDRIALYQGFTGTTASPTALSGLGFPSQPDLAIIAFGVNDAAESVSRANFRDALDRLVWALRYGKVDACSIIIAAMWTSDGTGASSTTVTNTDFGSASATVYRDIRAAMLEVAQAEGCAFVDFHGLFGRQPVANGWVASTSDLHPTVAGHKKISDVFSLLV